MYMGGPSRSAVQNTHAHDMDSGLRPGSLSTWIRVSSICNRVCVVSRDFMRSRTGESHSFHDSMTQPAIACLVTVRFSEALRSDDIR